MTGPVVSGLATDLIGLWVWRQTDRYIFNVELGDGKCRIGKWWTK